MMETGIKCNSYRKREKEWLDQLQKETESNLIVEKAKTKSSSHRKSNELRDNKEKTGVEFVLS